MRRILYWIPVFIIMFLIFYFSMDGSTASDYKSNGIADIIINIFNLKNIDPYYFNIIIRKIAHFGIYFILGFFVINALYKTTNLSFFNCFIIGLLMCLLYASSDEIHQHFVPGRSGELRDVLIDFNGSSLCIMFYYFYLKLFVKSRNYDKIKLVK